MYLLQLKFLSWIRQSFTIANIQIDVFANVFLTKSLPMCQSFASPKFCIIWYLEENFGEWATNEIATYIKFMYI